MRKKKELEIQKNWILTVICKLEGKWVLRHKTNCKHL